MSVEIVKVVQSMVFMAADRDMYDPASDTPALARTSNLNEELGQVSWVERRRRVVTSLHALKCAVVCVGAAARRGAGFR